MLSVIFKYTQILLSKVQSGMRWIETFLRNNKSSFVILTIVYFRPEFNNKLSYSKSKLKNASLNSRVYHAVMYYA